MPFTQKSEQVIKKKNERDALDRHYRMNRQKVSVTLKDMINFCRQHQMEDPLIFPVRENPFKEKKTCQIL
ncbi:hypothetical protein DPMN_030618 [Dreissena polymorpha]|uniref:G protein gamma domain-containing protein n=1 Tax=Dreissena polymorpha TaxID=45954 RepID=A0A9D4M0K5_DREPO|nr:hypothetical protein DPMN_030537 [Dreissena polymorpha]KAH3867489.1 hypothetical protein DPMN_030618 [Dreissena polymorpha]